MNKRLFCLFLPYLLSSCSYLEYTAIQAEYSLIQKAEPGQVNLKHMIDRETFFVHGITVDNGSKYSNHYLAIAAYSNKFKVNERVDTMYFASAGTHYGLNLPEGIYTLLTFADLDGNKIFDQTEIVGQRKLVLNETAVPEKVLGHVDIELTDPKHIEWAKSIVAPERVEPKKSLFYPAGTIRSLSDPIFDDGIATLGMYDPASFMERAPIMFYALEEDMGHKIPIVFVHGIGGSSRAFLPIVERLNPQKYKPWFFYYPSGGDLDQLSELFYRLFLSGKVIPLYKMPMITVAHSMGGLIVREALNKYENRPDENITKLFITLATPFGGHPAAASGEKHGIIVLPAWRDVNPESKFIKELYRKPLPESVHHQLIYAFHNPDTLKMSENSDGVVPLSSQLHRIAQKQSQEQFGFNSSHTSILHNEEMITHIIDRMDKVENFYPADHLAVLSSGGYDLEADSDYGPIVQFVIRTYGRYFMAITDGTLKPFYPEQEEFVRVTQGEEKPTNEVQRGWLRYLQEHTEITGQ